MVPIKTAEARKSARANWRRGLAYNTRTMRNIQYEQSLPLAQLFQWNTYRIFANVENRLNKTVEAIFKKKCVCNQRWTLQKTSFSYQESNVVFTALCVCVCVCTLLILTFPADFGSNSVECSLRMWTEEILLYSETQYLLGFKWEYTCIWFNQIYSTYCNKDQG